MKTGFWYVLLLAVIFGCKNESESIQKRQVSEKWKEYWYSGKAEITSYDLEQARYGELRKGEAVLVFVTEDFLPEEQVKANKATESTVSVLKLNKTKKFLTGIYPYSIMESTFFPVAEGNHAIKVSASIQEWCGQVYAQLNNREKFEFTGHSYFQGEADQNLSLEKTWLENEIWTLARITPQELPVGELKMIPSLEYLRLSHQELKSYTVEASYYTSEDVDIYTLEYPELNRSLNISINRFFPHSIEKWEEILTVGGKNSSEVITTTATKKSMLKTDYWNRNSNKDLYLRDSLKLN